MDRGFQILLTAYPQVQQRLDVQALELGLFEPGAFVSTDDVGKLLRRPDMTTAQDLARCGFTSNMIESFWRPLFAGIRLDPDLEVSRRRTAKAVLRYLHG